MGFSPGQQRRLSNVLYSLRKITRVNLRKRNTEFRAKAAVTQIADPNMVGKMLGR